MKETTMWVVDCINKYSNKSNCLLAGDWNEIPSVLKKMLLEKGIQVYTNDKPTKGTRVYQNRKRAKRPIDYGLSNNHQLIASQCCRYYPVLMIPFCKHMSGAVVGIFSPYFGRCGIESSLWP
jgi:hypothetical protein